MYILLTHIRWIAMYPMDRTIQPSSGSGSGSDSGSSSSLHSAFLRL